MLTIIFCWIFLFFVVYFIGRLFLNTKILSYFKIKDRFEWYEYFWSGLFAVFGIIQIWSIFLPVNIFSMLFMIFLAVVSFVIIFKKGIILPKKINYGFIIVCIFGLLIISYYATQPTYMPDTMGYHLNAVKWTNLYAVVPGLANLHSRLGFNTSFFQFASMLNNWFMRDRVSHLAISFLVATLFVEFTYILFTSKKINMKLFCLFIVPAIVGKVVNSEMISSLYYDFALIIFILAACIEFIQGGLKSLIVAGLISMLIFTVKLSGASFSFLILLFVIYKFIIINSELRLRYMLTFLSLGLFIIVPFLVRNVILSGWLFYPLPIINMNFDWTMPISRVERIYTVTQTWAKFPGTRWSEYINSSFWDWFPQWYSRNSGGLVLLFFALALALISPLIFIKKRIKYFIDNRLVVLSLISLVSFLYILFTAPDLRFGGIYIWIFFATICTIYLSNLVWDNTLKIIITFLSLIFIFYSSWPIRLTTKPILRSIRWDQSSPTENINGILMPLEDSCGNSDLPCTPEKNNIKWRVPGDMSKGFAPIK